MKELFAKFNEFREKIQKIPSRIEEANNKVDFSSNRYQEIMIDLEGMTTDLAQSDFFFFCEFIENTIKNQNQENEQLKARVARLEQAKMTKYPTEKCKWVGDYLKVLKQVLNETHKQSLAEIKAAAVRDAVDSVLINKPNENEDLVSAYDLVEYADQLQKVSRSALN